MSEYPCPCDKCNNKKCKEGGKQCKSCSRYTTWIRWWWKRFKGAFCPVETPKRKDKFCYSHPDDVKRYLETGPCENCLANTNCDTPCKAYLQWYDARMEIVRKRMVQK